jgi:hypothetical protein
MLSKICVGGRNANTKAHFWICEIIGYRCTRFFLGRRPTLSESRGFFAALLRAWDNSEIWSWQIRRITKRF